MCFTICKRLDRLVGDPLHCSMWCSNKSKGFTAMRLSAVETISQKHVSGPGGALLLGCFTTCKKNQAHQRNMYYTKHTSCFQTALKHLHQTIQDIQKGILRLISITLRDCQNNYSSLLKSLQSKNILKNVMLQDFMTKRSMHIKQFTEAFQWDGQSLAPRAYGGWGWAGGGAKNEHPSSNQNNVFSQQTSNKIWSAIVLHPQK